MTKLFAMTGIFVFLFIFSVTETKGFIWEIGTINVEFLPPNISNVELGDTIRWIWEVGNHTTTSTTIPVGADPWDAPLNSGNQVYEYIPEVAGTYNYICVPHQSFGMVGSFTVLEPAGNLWEISTVNVEFIPSDIPNVEPGDIIRWIWVEGNHTTTSTTIPEGAAPWDALLNSANQEFEYIPTVPGTYDYICVPHAGLGMVGSFTVLEPAGIAFNLKVFLEGPYDAGSMTTSLAGNDHIPLQQPFNPGLPYHGNNNPVWLYSGSESVASIPPDVVDWVLVELRDAASAALATGSTLIDRQALFLKSDGTIVGLNGSDMPTSGVQPASGLFAVVYHRNHLAVMNAMPIADAGGNQYNYDFTTGSDKYHGGTDAALEIAPGVWGMFSADGNGDNLVDMMDKSIAWETEAGMSGYISTDYSLNSQSDNTDKTGYWEPNIGKGSQIP
ncbi:MAG: hypothetical protein JW731_16110 [Bacteroidales bacterium]|nr:hypothetical protein [Bacteroidales bacterium]